MRVGGRGPHYKVVAFIEKTPRVVVQFPTCGRDYQDQAGRWWHEGPKGQGGADGHLPENGLYGFYQPSREWCDRMLLSQGYELGYG